MPLRLFFYFLILPFLAFAQDKTATEMEDLLAQMRANTQVENGLAQLAKATGRNPDCPPKPAFDFDQAKRRITELCTKVHSQFCEQFVSDYFKVSSPRCGSAKPNDPLGAAGCVMGLDYLTELLNRPENPYQKAIFKFDQLAQKANNGDLKPPPKSFFDIALQAANGDRSVAVTLIAMGQIGGAGFSSLIGRLGPNFDNETKDILKKWSKTGAPPFKDFYKKDLKNTPDLPDGVGPKEEKSYHFWARAFVSAQLKALGYSDLLATASSAASGIVYEFHFDWAEHKSQGVGFKDRLESAWKDSRIASAGARFGVKE